MNGEKETNKLQVACRLLVHPNWTKFYEERGYETRKRWQVSVKEAGSINNIHISQSWLAGPGRSDRGISVTGSRIRMTDGMASPVPVTRFHSELQDFDPAGALGTTL